MKTIVITGATKGIGRAISERFAKEGFAIAICSRNEEELNKFAKHLKKIGANQVIVKRTDVSKKKEVKAFADFVNSQFQAIDILINNAGVYIPGKICEEEDGALESMIETNLYSAYHLTRFLLPKIKKSAKAHVFNVCSTASVSIYENGGSYCISKFAMLGMSKVLREELKKIDIKVSALLPGPTFTASWEGAEIPEERFIQAAELADLTWALYNLPGNAVVEEIIIRPQLGDL